MNEEKPMKKLTALFLAILTLFCFTACAAELQNADASEKAEAAEGEEAEAPAKKPAAKKTTTKKAAAKKEEAAE